ncbi:iron-containing redox enzyme family protein [Pseudomonas cannabina pv. alisalensis]|uniref:Iron-containing redox enzyme family protein n=1 Tax=Pseudomonas syringae pv. maculicola str. ES4326 TaxID=629265 RepID=A0A8T8BVZ4_PSEYM|nr:MULTISPECIES: iron-containing redox enzyme family protein [Pseudomonas syringae group]QHE95558.1 iron-containing redox enzyme family protein [Pseudomonas syringae pv. maculicola str. ES4326]UBY96181.1 iron-containing redox enzyme family protein [Pseudomonas cannabina pv. alisalensis]
MLAQRKESDSLTGEEIILSMKQMIDESGINENVFYKTFRKAPLAQPVLKRVFQQYFYYIRTFPQILAGTSHRTENELIRMKLARTVVSELGDGVGEPHFLMFQRVLKGVGVELDDWQTVDYIPEAHKLVDGLKRIFLEGSTEHAIGAHYIIEEFGFPMIANLYEGFRLYEGWKHEDFTYFYLHMQVETDHVEWISEAVMEAAKYSDRGGDILEGAHDVLGLLTQFWKGLDRIATHS